MRRAILIGAAKYEDSAIPDLHYANFDALRISQALAQNCGIDQENIKTLLSPCDNTVPATRNNIVRELLNRPMEDVELLVVFFSGHGFRSAREQKDYLLPQDTVAARIEYSALSLDDLVSMTNEWNARYTLIFLDACRNIADGGKSWLGMEQNNQFTPAQFSVPGIAAFFSCAPKEQSYEIAALESGIFTQAIIEALGDIGRCRTIGDVDRYLTLRVPQISLQHKRPIQTPYTRVEPPAILQATIVSSNRLVSLAGDFNVRQQLSFAQGKGHSVVPVTIEHGILAVDFGSSTSLAAIMLPDQSVRYVTGPDGRRYIPSLVFLTQDLDFAVGADVLLAPNAPGSTVYRNFKRLLATQGGNLPLPNSTLTPIALTTLLLMAIKEEAEHLTGTPVTEAIAAVPANFGISGSNALAKAFSMAGIRLRRLVGEPCAAALCLVRKADQLFSRNREGESFPRSDILIVDIGGGTTDIAVVEIAEIEEEIQIEVLSVSGSNKLGGSDFDKIIYELLSNAVEQECIKRGTVLSPRDYHQLESDSERIKIAFNSREIAYSTLSNLEADNGLIDLEVPLHREDFELRSEPLVAEIKSLVDQALSAYDSA